MCEYMTGEKIIACVEDGADELDIDADFLAGLYE